MEQIVSRCAKLQIPFFQGKHLFPGMLAFPEVRNLLSVTDFGFSWLGLLDFGAAVNSHESALAGAGLFLTPTTAKFLGLKA
jgi:hypothetical protein